MQHLGGAREALQARDLGEGAQVRELDVHRRSISNQSDPNNSFPEFDETADSDAMTTVEPTVTVRGAVARMPRRSRASTTRGSRTGWPRWRRSHARRRNAR